MIPSEYRQMPAACSGALVFKNFSISPLAEQMLPATSSIGPFFPNILESVSGHLCISNDYCDLFCRYFGIRYMVPLAAKILPESSSQNNMEKVCGPVGISEYAPGLFCRSIVPKILREGKQFPWNTRSLLHTIYCSVSIQFPWRG